MVGDPESSESAICFRRRLFYVPGNPPNPEVVVRGTPSPATRRTSGFAWVLVALFFLVLILDLIMFNNLSSNANDVFQTDPPAQK